MYIQWVRQDKPEKKDFVWTPGIENYKYSKPIWGTEEFFFIDFDEPFGFLAWNDTGTVYLILRGTTSVIDIKTDLEASQDPYKFVAGYGEVHNGFLELYESMHDDIFEALKLAPDPKEFFVAGHSLGAAVLTLAIPDIITNTDYSPTKMPVTYYNIASPNVASIEFAEKYNENKVPTFSVINTSDVIPQLPPPVLPNKIYYERVGTTVTFTAQYKSLMGNHIWAYSYALKHPNSPQGPNSILFPPGPYKETCKDIEVTGNKLSAMCLNDEGVYEYSKLKYMRCKCRPIINDNGKLRCKRD